MSKKLFVLLVTCGSFSLVLLLANSSQAAPIISNHLQEAIFHPSVTSNLSLVSPSLNWTQQQPNPILHSLGCTCATCTQPSTSNVSIGI